MTRILETVRRWWFLRQHRKRYGDPQGTAQCKVCGRWMKPYDDELCNQCFLYHW